VGRQGGRCVLVMRLCVSLLPAWLPRYPIAAPQPSALGAVLAPQPQAGYCQPKPGNRRSGTAASTPPYLYARARNHIEKFIYIAFIVEGVPV
jgi:hypothetical protein